MSNPFFSIIIPAYNSEEHIDCALSSIASQSFRDFELIVVCDSCNDQTEQVARSYGAKTYSVRYGCDGLTRDFGIEKARGDWVMFLDDDDWYLHEYCFQLLHDVIVNNNEVDAIAFSYIWKDQGYIKQNEQTFSSWETSHVWSKCWRRSSIRDARFGNAKYCSDTYFLKRIRPYIKRIVFYDMPIVYYNFMRKGSQSFSLVNGDLYSTPVAR